MVIETPIDSVGRARRLLFLTTKTGYQALAFLEAARKMKVAMVLGTDRCHVLKDPWQDGALPLRFEDPEASAQTILEYARDNPIDGIISAGDRPAATAAFAARALQIPYHPPAAAAASHDKFKTRQLFEAAGLPVPPFARYSMDEDPRRALDRVPFPCVLKPLALSGSRGVIRADNPERFVAAFERIRALLRKPEIRVLREEANDWILVEGFIEGGEVAVEGILERGRLRILAIFDKPDPLDGPFFEETIYTTPSRRGAPAQAEIEESTRRAARALGLFHGPIHAEIRFNAGGAWPLEVAARPIGGHCSRALRFDAGVSLEEVVIRHALQMDLDSVELQAGASGVMMIPIPKGGIFKRAEGTEAALETPGVEEVQITAKPDFRLDPLPEGSTYLGFIFARGFIPEAVEQALRAAHSQLRFVIAPDIARAASERRD